MNRKCTRCSKPFNDQKSPVCRKCGKCNCLHCVATANSHFTHCTCEACR
jgi:hypothetical protein